MQKSFKIIFYTLLGLFCCGIMYLTTVMYLSPRQDVRERGFIPCTKQLVIKLQNCNVGGLSCPFMRLIEDIGCNIRVVCDGVAYWLGGKQSAPWSNYLFEPQLYENDNPDEAADGIDSPTQMQNLAAPEQFIKQKQQELEEAKQRMLNIQPHELLSDPDQEPNLSGFVAKNEVIEDHIVDDDIADEAEIHIQPEISADDKAETVPANNVFAPKADLIKKINKVTQEKLRKGNSEDEK